MANVAAEHYGCLNVLVNNVGITGADVLHLDYWNCLGGCKIARSPSVGSIGSLGFSPLRFVTDNDPVGWLLLQGSW